MAETCSDAPGAIPNSLPDSHETEGDLFPLPSGATTPKATFYAGSSSLTPLICDERAIARLLEQVISKGGLSINEAARRLGINSNSIRQYLHGRRSKPSLIWFLRLVEVCGAKVSIEFPRRG